MSPQSDRGRFDNATAKALNSLYKWELVYPHGPLLGLDDLEYHVPLGSTGFNHRRLHQKITGDNTHVTPAEFEAIYKGKAAPPLRPLPNSLSSHETRSDSVVGTRGPSPLARSARGRNSGHCDKFQAAGPRRALVTCRSRLIDGGEGATELEGAGGLSASSSGARRRSWSLV